MDQYDVLVVGAGPAGCAAARDLARGGLKVAMLDKAVLPRYKTCGGGLLSRAYRMLPAVVSQVVDRSFHSIQLNFLDRGLSFRTQRDQPVVYMTMRADLDYLLAREAATAGAELLQGCSVKEMRASKDGAELQTSNGPLKGRFVVAADGANSKIAREAGWPESRHLIPALEYEITVSEGEFRRMADIARFDFGGIDHGYAWVFPKRGHLSVGILTMRRGRVNLHEELERYLRSLGIGQILSAEKHGHLIPVSPRKEGLAKDCVFLTGDAAGLADPVTAEGISYATLSGQLAARAILSQTSAAAAVAAYEESIATEVLAELKAARALAHILYYWRSVRNLSFRLSGQRLCEFVTDVAMGDRSYRKAVRNPLNYLKALIGGSGRSRVD